MGIEPRAADGATIVAAEDEPDVRRLLAFVLRRRGDTVLEAADGAAALALIRRARPAVAGVDVRMPGLDGVAVTRALRADAATRTMPVLLVSAAGQTTDVAALAEAVARLLVGIDG